MFIGIPAVSTSMIIINEETQIAACFLTFLITVYTQAGDAIGKSLDDKTATILADHTRIDDLNVAAVAGVVAAHKNRLAIIKEMDAIAKLTVAKVDVVSMVAQQKVKYGVKSIIENQLTSMIAKEAILTETIQKNLARAAVATVTADFEASKTAKASALDAAIATLKGGAAAKDAVDPIQKMFVDFFKANAIDAKKNLNVEKKMTAAQVTELQALVETFKSAEGLENIDYKVPTSNKASDF
jgi:hypothetical protein